MSMKITCFVLLSLFAGSLTAPAQTSETSSGKFFLFKNYSTQNGLINNAIWTIAQDRNGYIWIGSDLGLTRFDGKTFYHKAIPEIYDNSAYVQYIVTTENGNIVTTSLMQGVFVQQDDGRFKQYLRKGYFELSKNIFNSLKYCPDGRILLNTTNSIDLLTADSIRYLYYSGNDGALFRTIDLDMDNRIWFGGRYGLGIMQLSGTEYEPVFLPEFKDKYIVKILFDDEGTLHVGTSQGYYRVKWRQPSNWDRDYTIEQPFSQMKDSYINQIYSDKEQNIWIPTSAIGVFRTKGDSITLHLTQENGLVSSTVECVMQDREGNYWFGTDSGISMIGNFDNYAIAQNGVRLKGAHGMTPDSYNRIWIYSRSRLYLFQDDRLFPVDLNGTPLERTGIFQINIFNSELLISNSLGLYKMPITEAFPDLRNLTKIAGFQSTNTFTLRSLVTDSTGTWIGTERILYNYYNRQFLPVTFNHHDTLSLRPNKMQQDKYGYYWYGDYTLGLYRGTLSRPDKNTLLFDNITLYKSLNIDSAFVTAYISDLNFDKGGNLWFASRFTGVYKLTIDSTGVVSDKLYSTANGLLSNDVINIFCDDEGNMWFMTQKGINILKYNSDGVETMDKLNVNEGIVGIAIWPVQAGKRLYLLTDEGFYVTQNQLFKEKAIETPKVFITNLLINGIEDSQISANSNDLHLTHTQNNLTFEYSAIMFRNVDDVRYQYKLEGADNDWSVLSDRGFVEYASLRPGKYTFKVRAAMVGAQIQTHASETQTHVQAGEETSLGFRIHSAFYQTVWFYSLLAVFALSLMYAFYNYRMHHLIKMERLRTRIASDLHDDIGSTLSSISLISDMAGRKDKESAMAKAMRKIGDDSRVVLNSMDDIIWSVKPQNDSLISLMLRLREYAIPVCESKNITFNMDVDETIHTMKLGMDERRNIYLISKESINNAVKHSGCSLLSVVFHMKHKQLEIKITDNGCGFDPVVRGMRNGITGMERRAKQIGMDFTVISTQNSGTTIMLTSGGRKN